MMIFLTSFIVILLAMVTFLKWPSSALIKNFEQTKNKYENSLIEPASNLTEKQIVHLPQNVQRYFTHAGYVGKDLEQRLHIYAENATIVMNDKSYKTAYNQYNYAEVPTRLALSKTSLYGMPLQVFDELQGRTGSMRGMLAKVIRVFDVQGVEMDQAVLVTFLSEVLFFPKAALYEYITWQDIDSSHTEATITFEGVTAKGIFTFNEEGLPISFTTADRYFTNSDNTMTKKKWTAVFDTYEVVQGVLRPREFSAIWHLPEKDLVYFSATDLLYS